MRGLSSPEGLSLLPLLLIRTKKETDVERERRELNMSRTQAISDPELELNLGQSESEGFEPDLVGWGRLCAYTRLSVSGSLMETA